MVAWQRVARHCLSLEAWWLLHGCVQASRERARVAACDLAQARTALTRALHSRDALGSGRLETRIALRVLTRFVTSPEAKVDAQALLKALGMDGAVIDCAELLGALGAFVAAPGVAADLGSSGSDCP